MSRFSAFGIHLGISLGIFAILAALVVYVWYPGFFFTTDGGWQGIRIIAFVDVVLGPFLTLVVFNASKPRAELRRDLTVIGTFQFVCLLAGTYVVFSERPLALVYVDGQFFSMSADDYREVGAGVPDLAQYPGPTPKRLMVRLPEDPFAQSTIRGEAWRSGRPLRASVDNYEPLVLAAVDAEAEALADDWLATREAASGDLSKWLQEHGGSMDDYAFFPFGARYGYEVLGVKVETGELIGLLASGYSTSGEVYENLGRN